METLLTVTNTNIHIGTCVPKHIVYETISESNNLRKPISTKISAVQVRSNQSLPASSCQAFCYFLSVPWYPHTLPTHPTIRSPPTDPTHHTHPTTPTRPLPPTTPTTPTAQQLFTHPVLKP